MSNEPSRLGAAGDPLYGIRDLLLCAAERLTEREQARLATVIEADGRPSRSSWPGSATSSCGRSTSRPTRPPGGGRIKIIDSCRPARCRDRPTGRT